MQRALTQDEATAMGAENVRYGDTVELDGKSWTVGGVIRRDFNDKSEYVLALEEVA